MFSSLWMIGRLILVMQRLTIFVVDGQSMMPALNAGDVILLDQMAYEENTPRRSDIIVFSNPKDTKYYYIKRIIGLPGERLHVSTNGLFLEKEGIQNRLLEKYELNEDKVDFTFGKYHDQIYDIPKDSYFVLGDNRARSFDSRSFVQPFVTKNSIRGKYLFRISNL